MKIKSESDTYQESHVTCFLTKEINKLLDEAKKRSGRSKKQEAEMRLADSLLRFQSLAEIGIATEVKP
ncbi:TraY domain-containing protein [Photobacterium phosphoreum]|uniref:TraY domain-containing protein n=1 Tax=Photobacterium phosphoreum TaxID=659 RepID=UPI001E334ED7|nr:TraY domain-containing protein [Photobacterium phosphoreum]MCD9504021.1 TraY domain-containing protein [Photobacterium phosphoreum]